MTQSVYLDYNATTPLAPEVLEVMLPYFREEFGNPSSIHSFGQRAKAALYDARERVASLIGASPNEILFTSGGTEADNLAILGVLEAAEGGRRHLVTSSVEHHAVLNTMKALAKKGVPVTFLKVDRAGRVDPEDLKSALTPGTLLVSIMHANNETGVVQPVAELARLTHQAGAYFHTDAVQSIGKIPVRVRELGVDLLSLSGHKIYGPKGTGALYVRRGVNVRPIFRGGGQERARRPGTENLPGLVGLGRAAQLAETHLAGEPNRVAVLRDRLTEDVLARIPGSAPNGAEAERTPNTVNLSFPGVEGETLIIALDLKGCAVSTGAACSSGTVEPSHVLIAMGLSPQQVQGSIRVSLGRYTTAEEIAYFVDVLESVVESIRNHAPSGALRS
ncbi:MAG TPA: cysteine desulfurase NifS [Vicinamibacteria bacterium]|nr:cysteine desulfurase NifS [Vicinamibacteria bacterium]